MPRSLLSLLGASVLAMAVAACGSSSSSTSSSTSAAGAASSATAPAATSSAAAATTTTVARSSSKAGATVLSIAANPGGALMFTKQTLSAKAGTVKIEFTNSSPLAHNFTVQKGTDGAVLGATPTFSGGTRSLTLKLAAGLYTYYCSVPGHRAAGMHGVLTVTR